MLVSTLKRGLFVPPITPIDSQYPPSLARKISPDDARIDWESWTATELERRVDIHGNVWTALGTDTDDNASPQDLRLKKRTILTRVRALKSLPLTSGMQDLEVGCFRYVKAGRGEEMMVVKCKNNGWVSVGGVKVEGKKEIEGGEWARGLQRRGIGKKFFSTID
jgi:methionyl-tRNA formyltransferase